MLWKYAAVPARPNRQVCTFEIVLVRLFSVWLGLGLVVSGLWIELCLSHNKIKELLSAVMASRESALVCCDAPTTFAESLHSK